MSNFESIFARNKTEMIARVYLTVYTSAADNNGCANWAFLLLHYSVKLLIKNSSIRPILEVPVNYRVDQNKRIPGSSFKFVLAQQQRLKMSQNNARNAPEIFNKQSCHLQNLHPTQRTRINGQVQQYSLSYSSSLNTQHSPTCNYCT